MHITVDIRPEVQAELARHAAVQGRAIETVAATLLEDALHNMPPVQQLAGVSAQVMEACEQLKTFGKRHGLSLVGTTLHDLRLEARP